MNKVAAKLIEFSQSICDEVISSVVTVANQKKMQRVDVDAIIAIIKGSSEAAANNRAEYFTRNVVEIVQAAQPAQDIKRKRT